MTKEINSSQLRFDEIVVTGPDDSQFDRTVGLYEEISNQTLSVLLNILKRSKPNIFACVEDIDENILKISHLMEDRGLSYQAAFEKIMGFGPEVRLPQRPLYPIEGSVSYRLYLLKLFSDKAELKSVIIEVAKIYLSHESDLSEEEFNNLLRLYKIRIDSN